MDPQDPSQQQPVYPAPDQGVPQADPPFEQPMPQMDQPYVAVPNVVIPEPPPQSLPRWFSVAFILTLLVFFAVSTLLVLSMMQKKDVVPAINITPTQPVSVSVAPTGMLDLTPSPVATSSDEGSSGDSLEVLQSDMKNVDVQNVETDDLP